MQIYVLNSILYFFADEHIVSSQNFLMQKIERRRRKSIRLI